MKTRIIILLLSCSLFARAQFAPVGASWKYNDLNGNTHQNFPRGIISITDTIILGHVCHIVIGNCACGTSQTNYIYEDNRKVYWYNNALNNFTLLYDFNLIAGESWTVVAANTTSDSLRIRVDSTDIDTINGFACMIQYSSAVGTFGNPYIFNGPIIEHIGSIFCLYPQSAVCDPPTAGLRCYSDSIIGLYDTHLAPGCDDVFIDSGIGIHEIENRISAALSPNPFHSEATVTLNNFQTSEKASVEILDATGRVIREDKIINGNSVIYRGDLEEGIYFYQILLRETMVSGKFIIY